MGVHESNKITRVVPKKVALDILSGIPCVSRPTNITATIVKMSEVSKWWLCVDKWPMLQNSIWEQLQSLFWPFDDELRQEVGGPGNTWDARQKSW